MLLYKVMKKKLSLTLFVTLFSAFLCAQDATFAEGLLRRKMYAEAADEFELLLKACKKDAPEVIDFKLRLAECYAKTGRTQEATKYYMQVAAAPTTGDHRATARLRIAHLKLEAYDYENAIAFFEGVVGDAACSDTVKHAALYGIAKAREGLNQPENAIKAYESLVNANDEYSIPSQFALIPLYEKTNQPEKALERCSTMLAGPLSESQKADAARMGFTIAYRMERYEEAMRFAHQQVSKDFPRLAAAMACLKAGHAEEAARWIANDKIEHPKGSSYRLALEGAVCEALHDDAGALTAFERILSEYPQSEEANRAAASMLILRAKQGRPEAFLEAYTRVSTRLTEEVKVSLAPYRLDAALRAKDEIAARAAAALLETKGSVDQAADALYRIAWLAQDRQDWPTAGETFLSIAEKWPTAKIAGRAAYAAAHAFFRAQMTDRQAQAVQVTLNSGDLTVIPDALMLRARMELAERNTAMASATLDEYLTRFQKAKEIPEANYLRGLIFFNAKDFVAAERCLEQACLLGAEENTTYKPLIHARRIDALLRRAQALHALNRGDEAAALLQPILELKDAEALDAAYLRWLAEFRLNRKEWEMAEQAARLMITRTTENSAQRLDALVLQAKAQEGLAQNASALTTYQLAATISLTPPTTQSVEAALGVGRLSLLTGANDAAYKAFVEASRIANQDTAEGRHQLATAYDGIANASRKMGELDISLRASMRLIIFFDDATVVPLAYKNASEILTQKGQTEQAESLRQEYQQRYGQAL